jgi:hypothetical protein
MDDYFREDATSLAVQDSQNPSTDGVHYTFAFTVTRPDFEKIKSMLLH